jgi:hypothetical protein
VDGGGGRVLKSPSPLGRLLEEISWEGNARHYRYGRRGFENGLPGARRFAQPPAAVGLSSPAAFSTRSQSSMSLPEADEPQCL